MCFYVSVYVWTYVCVCMHPSMYLFFFQAALIQPIFLSKIQEWAESSRGLFPSKSKPVYLVPWPRDKAEQRTASQIISWAKIKNQARALEKMSRAYSYDASRLVDVVRQCIVFEHLTDLVTCVRSILRDTDVQVMRIKNRFNADGAGTGGYRDVNVSVVICKEESMRLGTSAHVCEVQLLLSEIYSLKSDEGHKRYVVYRNQRAE